MWCHDDVREERKGGVICSANLALILTLIFKISSSRFSYEAVGRR